MKTNKELAQCLAQSKQSAYISQRKQRVNKEKEEQSSLLFPLLSSSINFCYLSHTCVWVRSRVQAELHAHLCSPQGQSPRLLLFPSCPWNAPFPLCLCAEVTRARLQGKDCLSPKPSMKMPLGKVVPAFLGSDAPSTMLLLFSNVCQPKQDKIHPNVSCVWQSFSLRVYYKCTSKRVKLEETKFVFHFF